ncbi:MULTISPECIES: hypothetical protein [unclassified Lentimonas]|uniref:hypothetical protein n=1 Tax=unclassified Lentimonas TaxID=2630993 RepID=UPI001321CA16|nr:MULTISPECIES: hypothetical protein [unclassified Lentimonas]CAA6678902.1 Unannotated [Lentimonas sp. CC4]CAA6684508.1 Unannotated [Lentimonas sp. CC6]CAA6693826.1 Unannotated [Lentimonas sp. CC19]CAA6695133.1 Unannotated [Lentimonas sp. CC10]CAA7069704.1 Unannotated [Lentimonas sp. CC11]
MNLWRKRFQLACLAVLSTAALHAQDVILRLAPSEAAPIIARVDWNTPEVQSARPVLEADKARSGWKWIEHTTTLDGYIPTSSLSKNFEIALNTHVRAAPKANAPILTSVQTKDRIQITASNDQWSTVRFRKAVPVYFREHTLPAHTADQVPGHVLPARRTIDPDAKTANIDPRALAPENVKWRAAPPGTAKPAPPQREELIPRRAAPSSIMTRSADLQESELPQAPQVASNAPIRNVNGILVREITNSGPRYPIRLITRNGQRIAYVDMSHVFISDLRPFLSKYVQIIGEVRPVVPGSQDLIIQARTIRIAE